MLPKVINCSKNFKEVRLHQIKFPQYSQILLENILDKLVGIKIANKLKSISYYIINLIYNLSSCRLHHGET